MLVLDFIGHPQMPAQPAHQRFIANAAFIFLRQRHLNPGEQQERPEEIQQPFELGDKPASREDHDSTQHDRAQYAVNQHTALQRCRHGEVAKQHQPDEDVVHRQRFFDQVTGEEGQRLRVSHRTALSFRQIPPERGVKQ